MEYMEISDFTYAVISAYKEGRKDSGIDQLQREHDKYKKLSENQASRIEQLENQVRSCHKAIDELNNHYASKSPTQQSIKE